MKGHRQEMGLWDTGRYRGHNIAVGSCWQLKLGSQVASGEKTGRDGF